MLNLLLIQPKHLKEILKMWSLLMNFYKSSNRLKLYMIKVRLIIQIIHKAKYNKIEG